MQAGRVICGCCGRAYGRKVWNSTDERLRRIIWRCNSKYRVKGKIDCESRQIEGEDILSKVTAKRFIATFQTAKPIVLFDTELYSKLIEKIKVHENRLVVSLLDGTEIECEIE